MDYLEGNTTQGVAVMVAREVIETHGYMKDWRNVVGTGPFMISDYVEGSTLTYERNPDYWLTDPVFPDLANQLPYLDGIKLFIMPDAAAQGLLVLLTVMSIVGRGTLQIIVVLGVLYGIHNSRILRSAVIGIKENDYIAAAKAIGNGRLRTVLRHVLPNIAAPVIIIYSINIGYIILDEAALSFLGFGLPLEVPSWGGMLSFDGRRYMERKPELATVSRHLPDGGGVRREHVRRRRARPARPAPQGRRRARTRGLPQPEPRRLGRPAATPDVTAATTAVVTESPSRRDRCRQSGRRW